jgi:dTDP-4-dehydrorhamnose 3,5-epimerase
LKIKKTSVPDLVVIEPRVFQDSRGFFFESYNKAFFDENFGEINFVQDNESKSKRGVLRGFHFQKPPFDQAKLVRCVSGEVLDVAVDLRKKSNTYGKHESIILSDKNKLQFFIPKGFAHAFLVLSETAIFSYKVNNKYAPNSDSGIIWNDPSLAVDWGMEDSELIISEKDKSLNFFSDLNSPF